ncbi:MAG: efflux RND transporter periplasmic adaptor subunit [Pseudomonadota bacterium]|nr:efflux RND transporter periplasmic adaptor subunit [Pseudomonadota bacterium]
MEKRKWPVGFGLIVLALVVLGVLVVYHRIANAPLPEGLIQANGRIEGDTVTVAAKYPGKVAEVLAREGEAADKGQLLVRLEDQEVQAKIRQADAGIAALEARRAAAHDGLDVLRKEVPLGIDLAESNLVHMKAVLGKAKAAEAQFRKDLERIRILSAKGTVEGHRLEEAELRWKAMAADLQSANTGVVAAQKQVSRATLGLDQIAAKEVELKAVDAELERVKAMRDEAVIALDSLSVTSPISGVLTARLAEPGEVGAAGRPLFEVVDLDQLYLKVYVAGGDIGKVRLNLPARVYVDAFPERAFSAEVGYISSRAEFTPKEVQTPDERTKQVYAVKLYLAENPDYMLSPGMPADAVIRWDESVPWQEPRW